MVTDKVSNLIVNIKNANMAGHATLQVPQTKLIESILNVLQKEGFIKSITKKGKKVSTRTLEVELSYEGKKPRITGVERVSKFSRRLYHSVNDIRPVQNGYGLMVYTTSKGILTGSDAKNQKVAGEALFKIW